MPLAHLRTVAAAAALAIVLPIVAACGGTPESAASPTAALPTAMVVPKPSDAGQPTAAAPEPTAAPEPPTAAPQPAGPTEEPLAPGTPIAFSDLQFGIVNHLYYTDRDRVLKLDEIAGFDWVRQQVVWKDIEGPEPGKIGRAHV